MFGTHRIIPSTHPLNSWRRSRIPCCCLPRAHWHDVLSASSIMTDLRNAAFDTRDAKVWLSTGASSPRALNPTHIFNITQTAPQIRVKNLFVQCCCDSAGIDECNLTQ